MSSTPLTKNPFFSSTKTSSSRVPFCAIIGNEEAIYSNTLMGRAPSVTSVNLSGPIPIDASEIF